MAGSTEAPQHTNRLANETSPYLLQHAHNPVDWFPWGPEALTRARLLDRPIFLSIGYAACHWCHVMERESFEDEATAAYLNDRFVSIKVDREERPDLDQIYMSAVQAMTGGGGWPMSVFLTPDGRPFYGGTYFPPAPSHGLPSFRQLLEGIDTARGGRSAADLEEAGARLVSQIAAQARNAVGPAPQPDLLDTAVALIEQSFDRQNGGWGGAPKFPQPMTIEFLLRRAAAGDRRALPMVAAIARQDGRRRHPRPARRRLPSLRHRRRLARAPLRADALRQRPARACLPPRVGAHGRRAVRARSPRARSTYLLREMTTDGGAFAASQDADTDGVEGATFTWRLEEIREALGDEAALFATAYGVTEGGNWEGVSILSRVRSKAELANLYGIPAADVEGRLERARTQAARACATGGPSRHGTTRPWPPGTAWRSARSRTRRRVVHRGRP